MSRPPASSPLVFAAGLALLLAAAIGSAAVGLGAVETLAEENAVADRPATVYLNLSLLLSAAQDSETGQRGYLLSGDEVYLEPFFRAEEQVTPLLNRLDSLVSWNPLQVERMPVLRSRIDSLLAYHERTIEIRRQRGLGVAVDSIETGRGKVLMDSVRSMVNVMQVEARRVRKVREMRVVRARRDARRSLWAATGILLLGLLTAAYAVRRALRLQELAATDLQTSNDALSQALAEREAALHRVRTMQGQLVQQEKLAGLGRLTAGVAHELKNPLNFVTNFAALADELALEASESLAAGDDPAPAREALDDLRSNTRRIVEHADRADQIVRSMLTHARGVTGTRQQVAVASVLADATAHALGVDGASDVRIVTEAPDEPVMVTAVPLALGRLFQNLISNAVYAVRERAGLSSAPAALPYTPTVTLRLRSETEHGVPTAVVEVEDNGAGIPDADIARIFEPFFTTKGPGQGTGLGLPLAHDIAVGHGGSLTAARAPSGGARFTVRLPLDADLGDDADAMLPEESVL